MSSFAISCTKGTVRTAAAISCAAGEELSIVLSLFNADGTVRDCHDGEVSFSFERPSRTGTPLKISAAGQVSGVHTITVPTSSTRLLDAQYIWDAWFTPSSGAPEKLILNGSWTVTPAVGSGDVSLDGWSEWTESNQSAVAGSYCDMLVPDNVNTYVYEMQLTLKGAVHTGWYTRFRMIAGATVVADATAPLYVRTGSQYSTATYSIVTVGTQKYLRFTLGDPTETFTTKIIRYRTKRL